MPRAPCSVAFLFGAIAMVAGIVGVVIGASLSQTLRPRFPFADPVICGVGVFLSVPLIMGGMVWAEFNTLASCGVVFAGQVFLNLNWSVVSDILMVSWKEGFEAIIWRAQYFKCTFRLYCIAIFHTLRCYFTHLLIILSL